MSRIKTIGGGGGGGGAPTVVVGPEFGTDILFEEHSFGSSFRAEACYPMEQEQVIRLFEVICGPHLVGVEHSLSGTYIGPPKFLGVESAASTAATSALTVSLPSTVAGTYQLAIHGGNSSSLGSINVPTGWTTVDGAAHSAGPTIRAFGRFTQAGDSTAVTFTASGASARIVTVLSLFGVDTADPISASADSTGSATDPVAASVSPASSNLFLVAACAQLNSVTQTYTPPANYTEQSDLDGAALVRVTGEVATRVQGSSGVTGTATMNSNQALASNYAALHIAVKPPAAGATLS